MFESTKKKEVGVSDLTLISKITNEAINENLKKRFENAEIYVSRVARGVWTTSDANGNNIDIHRPCTGVGQSVPRS